MKRKKITISSRGSIIVPDEVRMSIGEIADLFGIFYQTVKRNIRAIEKSGITSGDSSMSCIVEGQKVYPEYYGLEMVIAVAFRVKSHNTMLLRRWITKRLLSQDITATLMLPLKNAWLN